jgi:hypothetical protein
VAAGSLAAIVIVGLLTIGKSDGEKLARLEAQQRSTVAGASAPSNSKSMDRASDEAASSVAQAPSAESSAAAAALGALALPEPTSGVKPIRSWFAAAAAGAADSQAAPVCSQDRSLRTALTWSKSPDEAAALARREGKLLFLIHVSGNFEDPGFT